MSEGRLLQYASEREHSRRSTATDGARAALQERDLSLIRALPVTRSENGRRGPAALLAAARRGLGRRTPASGQI